MGIQKEIGKTRQGMITLYYGKDNQTNKKARTWFEKMGIGVCAKKIEQLSREDLIQILFYLRMDFWIF